MLPCLSGRAKIKALLSRMYSQAIVLETFLAPSNSGECLIDFRFLTVHTASFGAEGSLFVVGQRAVYAHSRYQ